MAEYKNVENFKKLFDEEFKKTRRLIQQGETHLDNLAEGFLEADRVIQKIPTADVVEVVRCEECKYKEDCARQMVHTTRDYMLEQNISSYNRVDFCSYGEKRSEGK